MNDIHLDIGDVSPQLRLGYEGRKFRARVSKLVETPVDASLCVGGSRNTYKAVRIVDGAEVALSTIKAPFDPSRRGMVVDVQPGFAMVEQSAFQGRDMGLRFHLHPDDTTRLLPAKVDLSDLERTVLDGILPMTARYREDERRRGGIGPAAFQAAVERLVELGLWRKNGGFTTAGKNARRSV